MTKQELIEFRRRKGIKIILDFLSNPNNFDYTNYINTTGSLFTNNVNKALEFAQRNLEEKDYLEFRTRVLPFEPSLDKDDAKEKEELKNKMANLAKEINIKNANLINMVDSGVTNLNQYIYMVKQLIYRYKVIPGSHLLTNVYYARMIEGYDDPSRENAISFAKLTNDTKVAVEEIIKSRNLLLNDITYNAAYSYYIRNKNKTVKENASKR